MGGCKQSKEVKKDRPGERYAHGRHSIGAAAEILVAYELLKRGFGVAKPLGINDPFDLISIGHSGATRRIQVKAVATPSHKSEQGESFSAVFRHGVNGKKSYGKRECDCLIVVAFFHSGPEFYVFPTRALTQQKRFSFWLTGRHPTFPDKWRICPLDKYRGTFYRLL